MASRVEVEQAWKRAHRRVAEGAWPVALAACGAALAWLIAHRLLGHRQPFFAPIAAAISLSTSRIQRSKRIAQMAAGVLLGIGIGELMVAALGSSTFAVLVIVFVTMAVALLSGVGFFSEGMMFANQAAASAILVVTVHRVGTGAERAIDALVGGAVAFALGVLLFPAEPLSLLYRSEQAVLELIERILRETVDPPEPAPGHDEWALEMSSRLNRELAAFASARTTARNIVRVAPRRWRLRTVVDAETKRTARFDLLANAALSLARAARTDAAAHAPLPQATGTRIAALADAVGSLASSPQPWTSALRAVVRDAARATAVEPSSPIELASLIGAALRTTGTDLAHVVAASGAEG